MGRTAEYWIKRLRLQPHPEGGYYRETYRSPEIIAKAHLPKRYNGKRPFATAIYFLLSNNQFSAFHRLKSDEIWHFYDGSALALYVITKNGRLVTVKLGLNAEKGEQLQYVIRTGAWFAAALTKQNPKSYALIGCTVAPGFDFADFELMDREELCRRVPKHRALIKRLTLG
ncbi:MAG: cupin domain-containing protein [Kiritimatiellia bacterium]|nr:cupin domain-containing protein [Kiritimatiellia bacterium]